MARTALGGYAAYNFRDHDPILDQIDRLYEKAGHDMQKRGTLQNIADETGVGAGTLRNWRFRKTRRPQYATVAAVVRALGGQVVVVYQNKKIPVRGLLPSG